MTGRRGSAWHEEMVDWVRFVLLPKLREGSRASGGIVWGMCDAPWVGCGIVDARSPDAAFIDDADVVLVEVGDMKIGKWPEWAVLRIYKDGGWGLIGPKNKLADYVVSTVQRMDVAFRPYEADVKR